MVSNKEFLSAKLIRWENYMNEFHLPLWSDIPDIGLYMDQMLTLLTQYLDYLPPELRKEEFLTAATIHNYVRRKIIPEPIGKKYYRRHIAYLIMICTLKQSLSLTTLQLMLPVDLPDGELQAIYESYSSRHSIAKEHFMDQIRASVSGFFGGTSGSPLRTDDVRDLISQSAILAGFMKLCR